MKKNLKALKYLLIIFLIVVTTLSTLSAVNSTKPLRLAVWNNASTAIVKDNGEVTGFEPELFRALSPFLSRQTEVIVFNNKAESLDALRNGDVDVVMSSLYTSDIDQEFDFTNIMVRHVDALLCSTTEEYYYQEYDKMANKKIGYLNRPGTIDPILEYLNGKIDNPILIPFNTVQEIRTSLEKGEIDLATFGIGALVDSYYILDRFYSLPTYYITRKGESRLINDALSAFLNNSLDTYDALYFKYYPRAITTEFTKEEKDFIENKKEIKVVTPSSKNVFSSIDSAGEIIGIFPDIIREINNISKLNLQLITTEENLSLTASLEQGKADIAIGLDCLKHFNYNSEYLTCDTVMSIPMELITKRSNVLNKDYVQKIGIPKDNCSLNDFVKENYPNWEIIYEPDLEERYSLLVEGKIDCLIDSSFSFNYLNAKPKFSNLTRYPLPIYQSDLDIVVKSADNRVLYNILNKSITQIKNKHLNSIVDTNIAKIIYTPTLYDLFISHRIEYLGILILIFFFFIVVYIIASNKRRVELEESNEELNIAKQEAIEANRAKSVFLARMSHDMRTPLGAVIGLADFGENEAKDKKIKEYFKGINSSASYLLSLMDDILDSQKLQNDNFEFVYEIIQPCEIFKRVKNVVERRASEKDIKFVINSNCHNFEKCVYADEKRVSQILINLLNNAIKYTPSKGTINWTSSLDSLDDETVKLTSVVQDNGVGMSEDFIKNELFKPFSKEHNSLSKSEGGTGLGLNICKKLVDQMNGTITCNSKLGVGTTFTLSIDLKLASEYETKKYNKLVKINKSRVDSTIFKGQKILVCDDTEINIKIIKKILEQREIIVDVAYDGKEAVEKAKKNYFDAILMDIRMPILDGLEATKQIRLFDKKIPIIAYSANAYAEDIEEAKIAGMNAHLAKPIDIDELFKVLESVIIDQN
ncbi:MAG: transporter substrate-binding domain-containing protein [Sphaerochaetaceae bacterium]|nr:transporter substrate-binding domain-containing protein [Sphaerochaetaceae bacterium]